ncbi:hypothetical protein N9M26_03820 [Alphaproteobacteria bacterium]|nr:hypothetical protein [Alphaproteobacteria bacterium]
MEDNTNLYNQRNILIRNFLIFSRLAPLITSLIGSILINKIFLNPVNLINLDFILIFLSLYLVLYVFISHTKTLCEQLAIVNQKIDSHNDS